MRADALLMINSQFKHSTTAFCIAGTPAASGMAAYGAAALAPAGGGTLDRLRSAALEPSDVQEVRTNPWLLSGGGSASCPFP